MKRLKSAFQNGIALLIIALTFSISATGYSQEALENQFDFRATTWGMTKEQVKNREYGEISEEEDVIVYADVVGGDMQVLIAYVFAENMLVKAKYLFIEKYPDKNDYVKAYEKVKETLTLKYGSPESDRVIWRDDLYKDDPQKRGLAVALGHLVYTSKWDTEKTILDLVLQGNKEEPVFGLVYSSKKLGHLAGGDNENDMDVENGKQAR